MTQKVAVKRADGKIVEVENWLDATNYVSLDQAISDIGTNKTTLLISTLLKIQRRYLDILSNVTLQFLHGGLLRFDFGATFEITEKSLDELEKLGVPVDARTRLETIAGKVFTAKKDFVDILKKTIGDELTVKYKSLILKYASQIVEINGEIQAGNYQIFTGSGTVSLMGDNHTVNVKWFGAVGDRVNNDDPAIQEAIYACPEGPKIGVKPN